MLLQKKWFEGSLKHFYRTMQHPDVDFAVAVAKNGNKYIFLHDPDRGSRMLGGVIGVPNTARMSFGQLTFTSNRDVDEHSIHYYTRDAYKHKPGLMFAPKLSGVQDNTNLYSAMMANLKDASVHVHTDEEGKKWMATRSSFRSRCIMLHPEGQPAGGNHRWIYGDVLDQYTGTWHFENLTVESVAKMEEDAAQEPAVPAEIPIHRRYELKELTDTVGPVTVFNTNRVDGVIDRKRYHLIINLEGLLAENQVLNLRPLLLKVVENFEGRHRNIKVAIDLDACQFKIDGVDVNGRGLRAMYPNKFYCSRVEQVTKLVPATGCKFPEIIW